MSVQFFLILRRVLDRKQPAETISKSIKAGIGGTMAIAILILLGSLFDNTLLMAPFGATCVLLFSLPASPLAQPINVIGGHLVSITIGLVLHSFLPIDWWSLSIAVGIAISVMAVLRVTHPPAGADPIVVFFSSPGWEYLIFPVFIGSIILVITAWTFHQLPLKSNSLAIEPSD